LGGLALGLEALDVLAGSLDPLLQTAPLAVQTGLAVCDDPQIGASGDQLLGRQVGELRAQCRVVGGELGAVALGGFGDVRDASRR
jgi:hypothetical protein